MKLEKIRRLTEYAVEHSALSVFLVDSGGRLVYGNSTLCAFVGFTPQEVAGCGVWELTTTITAENWPVRWQEVKCAGSLHLETAYRTKSGDAINIELRLTFLEIEAEEYIFGIALDTEERQRTEQLLLTVAGGVSATTQFFHSLVRHLASALKADYAIISESAGTGKQRSLAAYRDGNLEPNFEYKITNLPATRVLEGKTKVYPTGVQALFPNGSLLKRLGIDGYAGTPLKDSKDHTIGVLAVSSRRPLEDPNRIQHLLEIFAARAGAEIERQRSHDALLYSEQRFRTLFESAGDAILVILNGRVIDCNRQAAEMYRCTREQLLQSEDWRMALSGSAGSQPSARNIAEAVRRAMEGKTAVFEWNSQRFDGTPFEMEASLTRADVGDDVYLLALAKDVTERRRTERALSHLSGRLLQMQDEERRRIALELHDTTGQNMAALQMTLSLALQSPALDSKLRHYLDESLMLAEVSLREIRTLSYLLHPPLLDELGLITALRAYAAGYSERTGVRVVLDLPGWQGRLSHEVEIALFRIVQEGLVNIHRHSGSPVAILRLATQVDSVSLELTDHGKGMPAHSTAAAEGDLSRIGVGIAGMRERTRQLRGKLAIVSGSHGTTLCVSLPLRPNENAG